MRATNVMAQLVSLCVTIGQKPAVRYHKNQLPWCEQLATLVHKALEAEEIPVRSFTVFLKISAYSKGAHLEQSDECAAAYLFALLPCTAV